MTHSLIPCPGAADVSECPVLRRPEKKRQNPLHGLQREEAIRSYVAAHKPATGRLLRGVFELKSLEEAEKLSTMLGSQCPDPETASVGIWELLSNAIEHGNLGIDRQTKAALLGKGAYLAELDARAQAPQYRHRVATIDFRRGIRTIRIRVMDQGDGFDFAAMMVPAEPSAAPNGRGLLMAREMAFDRLTFHGAGNIVEATIRI